MDLPRRRSWTLAPLLAGAVLVQGAVSLVPHDHHPATVIGSLTPATHRCAPDRPELAPISESLPASTCLACVITPLAFAQPDAAFSLACLSSSSAATMLLPPAVSLPRPWRCQLRGPPHRA